MFKAISQTLQGAGTVSGGVAGVTGSKISPGGSGNDVVAVTSALTIGSGKLLLNAVSGAANLDTTSDYVLTTAASISGSFAATPTWAGTPPANAANFSIVTNSTQVKLHYAPVTPPQMQLALNGSQLQIAWPTNNIGWRLEAQTNSLNTGLGKIGRAHV